MAWPVADWDGSATGHGRLAVTGHIVTTGRGAMVWSVVGATTDQTMGLSPFRDRGRASVVTLVVGVGVLSPGRNFPS